ncbi:hypothetical protein ACFU6S_40450, partial [Streptomyces sp. NPDC057456]
APMGAASSAPIGAKAGTRRPSPPRPLVTRTAEIIADTNRGTGLPLSRATGPIHRPLPAPAPG